MRKHNDAEILPLVDDKLTILKYHIIQPPKCWLEGTAGGLCPVLLLEMKLLPSSRLGQLRP